MNVVVLAGSPKGEKSVTMQYVRYLEKRFKEDRFTVRHIVPGIKKLEGDRAAFDRLVEEMSAADLVLWSFPLYFFVVHSGYKRLIELLYEREARHSLAGKPAAVLTTSIHFHDSTAVTYMRGVLEDLGMVFADCHTPAMKDLMKPAGRLNLELFYRNLRDAVKVGVAASPAFGPVPGDPVPYTAGTPCEPVRTGGKIVILADTLEGNTGALVETFRNGFADKPPVYTLADMGMKGPCLGCLRCGADNICAWEEKDGYVTFFREQIASADMLVFAGRLRDRYLSSEWKQFIDRSFFSTHHQKPMWGKQLAFLLSGSYSRMPALQEFITCYTEQFRGHLAGVVTDESGSPEQITGAVRSLILALERNYRTGYFRTPSFAGIAGLRLFRDEIFDELRIVFKADHRVFRKHGIYDFATRNPIKRMVIALADAVTRLPPVKKGMQKGMIDGMIQPYKKILDGVE